MFDSSVILVPLLLSRDLLDCAVKLFSTGRWLDANRCELLDDTKVKLEVLILLDNFLSTLTLLFLGSTVLDHSSSFTLGFRLAHHDLAS